MTLIDHTTDHESVALARYLDQFKNSVDLKALGASYVRQIQELEDAVFEVILERTIPTAVGAQLTALGAIVQQPRTTAVDADYAIAIQARIAINLSDSTPEDVITVGVLALAASGEAFYIREEPPAQLRFYVIDPLTISPALLHQLLEATDPAANRLLLNYSKAATSSRFRFTDSSAGTGSGKSGTGSAAGFGDTGAAHTGGLVGSVTEG